MADVNKRTEPLRLTKTREEFEAYMADPERIGFGVSASSLPDEEGVVALSVTGAGTIHLDVEYAQELIMRLAEAVSAARKHNRRLGIKPGGRG